METETMTKTNELAHLHDPTAPDPSTLAFVERALGVAEVACRVRAATSTTELSQRAEAIVGTALDVAHQALRTLHDDTADSGADARGGTR
jgi:hypothetical protein